MNLIGFAFTKLHANRSNIQAKKTVKTNNLELVNLEKEDVGVQLKNAAYRASFKYTVSYTNKESKKDELLGEVLMEGYVVLALENEEEKEFTKSWKKKEVPAPLQQPLFNLILKKCAPKAIELEDTVGLPFHIPIPQVRINKSQN